MPSCASTSANACKRAEAPARCSATVLLLFALLAGAVRAQSLAPPPGLADEAAQVVVVYNSNEARSREVAEFYAQQRGVPADRLVGVACIRNTELSRTDFERQIQEPLRQALIDRKLATFTSEKTTDGVEVDRTRWKLLSSKVRYLLLVYGMPYRIGNDTNFVENVPTNLPPQLHQNGASVDSELMLLPVTGSVPITGVLRNPFYGATNATPIHPGNGVFMVSRLDGPTPELAMGLVTKAMSAEQNGLWGRAYIDLRDINDGQYKTGDEWLASAESVCKILGFETYVDRNPATFSTGFPLSEVAVYAGWYDQDASGPFTLPTVEFAPGAIAYHIHSFSAYNPRSLTKNWVGPLIAKGATVTMGCVNEPYLSFTPNFGIFLSRLAGGFNFAEAGFAGLPVLSWQNILVGDPLYRPFRPNLIERATEMERTNSPFVPWAIVQKINFHLSQGGNPDAVMRDLEEMPMTATNAPLAEKVARLYESKSRLKQAIAWGQKALAANATPQQRVRLLLDVAAWQKTLDRPKDSFATLEAFAVEFPGHPHLLAARKDQLELAKDLDLNDDIARLKAEIVKLTPPDKAR